MNRRFVIIFCFLLLVYCVSLTSCGSIDMEVWLLSLDALGLQGPVKEILSTTLLPHYGYGQDQRYCYRFNEKGYLIAISEESGDPFPFRSRIYSYSENEDVVTGVSEMDWLGSGWQGLGFELLVNSVTQTDAELCLSFTLHHLNESAQGCAFFDSFGRIDKVDYFRSRHWDFLDYEYESGLARPVAVVSGWKATPVWDEDVELFVQKETHFTYDNDGALLEAVSRYTDPDGIIYIRQSYEYHEFDSRGNWISRTRTEHYGGASKSQREARLIYYYES